MKTKKNIPAQRGFKVPKDYFDTSQEMILDRLELEMKLGKATPTPFNIPEGYFDTGRKNILETLSRKRNDKIDFEPAKKIKVISLKNYVYSFVGIAAALLLLVSILWVQTSTNSSFTLENHTIVEYLDDDSIDLENIDFTEWLTDEDIDALQNDIALDDSTIIDYLDDRTDSYDFYTQ